jgi:glycosyltransferase involved in cell wall biosynthesis
MRNNLIQSSIPTVSIGIPAYNEEQNIEKLLRALLSQSQRYYLLEKVVVVCDGCTDQTVPIVQKLQKKYPIIHLLDSQSRGGKSQALNSIYDSVNSDFLLTLDADILPAQSTFLDNLVNYAQRHPDALVVGPRHLPRQQQNFWGKCAVVSYKTIETAFFQLRHGRNMYAIMSATLIRQPIYKRLRYPYGVMADQCYLYAYTESQSIGSFHFVLTSQVWFSPVTTLADWRLLASRSTTGDRRDVVKHFGAQVISHNIVSKKSVWFSYYWWFLQDPLHTVGSLCLNIFIRLFPLHRRLPANGLWEPTQSTRAVYT